MSSLQHLMTVGCAYLAVFLVAGAPVRAQSGHPLDPLAATEIERAIQVLEDAGRLGAEARFALIDHEPSKTQVMEDLERGSSRRSARMMLYDWATHAHAQGECLRRGRP